MDNNLDTIPAMFFAQAERFGERAALLHKINGAYREISWREVAETVREVAAGLLDLGVKSGDRVAIMAYNRPEWLVADLAIMSAGAITVPIYHTSTRTQSDYILKKGGVDIAFVARSEKAAMLTTCDAAIKTIISLDPVGVDTAGGCATDFNDLRMRGREVLASGRVKELDNRTKGIKPDDCATIIFTSGTTGSPKGVMLSHTNILSDAKACLEAQPVSTDDIFLSFLPLSHSFERTAGQFLMLVAGANTAYAESIRAIADNIREVRPTIILGVPRFYEKLHAKIRDGVRDASFAKRKIFAWALLTGHRKRKIEESENKPGPFLRLQHQIADQLVFSKLRARLGGRLRFFVSGGAPLAPNITEFFLDAGVQILEGYGLTEYSPVIAVNRLDRIKPGTVGPPLPGCKVRIREDQELEVSGPSVMLGYYKDPEATAAVIEDGWLKTGDLAALEDRYLRILDRKKDIIVTSGGKNITPGYIENLLTTDSYISQIVLYGDRKKYLTGLLVPDYEALASQQPLPKLAGLSPAELAESRALNEFMMNRINEKSGELASFEQVKKIVILSEPLTEENGELTPTMKIKRKEVIRKFQKRLDALYEEDESRKPKTRWP